MIDTGVSAPPCPTNVDLTNQANILTYAQTGLTGLLPVNKYHDVFTSALPSPLKGPESQIPISGVIPVKSFQSAFADDELDIESSLSSKFYPIQMKTFTGDSASAISSINAGQDLTINSSGQVTRTANTSVASGTYHPIFTNLGVDLGDAVYTTINDLRLSFATQRYYEQLARSGSRYTEILSGLFGVESPDSRLQRPEFLGASHSPLNVEQVVQTSESTSNSPLGETGAYSLSFDTNFSCEKSFVEHGWIIGLACIRIDRNYQQSLPRWFRRRTKFDYYWPTFANIGEVGIRNSEIYSDGSSSDNQIFGFQEAWYEYRYSNSANVTSEMRSNYAQSLDVWHLADDYSSLPTLSDCWLREDKSNLDRCLTVQSSVSDQALINFHFDVKATRPLPVYSIPGGLDLR